MLLQMQKHYLKVVVNVSLGCIAHQHCLNRYDFNLCLKTVRLREGSLELGCELPIHHSLDELIDMNVKWDIGR